MPTRTCQENYSVIEHIARTCSPSNWQNVLMVMLSTAFDVSYDEPQHTFLVMAGFVSEAECWKNFDVAWRKRLAVDSLTYFHMHSFAQSSKPFDFGWKDNENRRRALMTDLLDIISAHAFRKFICVVQTTEFAKLSAYAKEKMGKSPLAIAGTFIVGLVKNWQITHGYKNAPEFFFEDGDIDKGTLMDAISEATGQAPIFRKKKDDLKRGITAWTPLQAADILAYETKKVAEKVADKFSRQLPIDFKFRFPWQALNRIPEEPAIFDGESASFIEICCYFKDHPLGKS